MACSPGRSGLVLPRKTPLFAPSDQTAQPLWLDAYLKLDQKKEEREICMLFVCLLCADGLLCGASGPARLQHWKGLCCFFFLLF